MSAYVTISMLVTVALIATSSISYRLGRESKRPPKPRPHQHSYGKWEKYRESRLISPVTALQMGWRNYYRRTCAVCGFEDFEEQDIR